MTPSEIITAARRQYNAVSDSFWTDAEILDQIYFACMKLALKGNLIEQSYTTTTVASTQEYAYPTNAYAIKRITYDGAPLTPIDFSEDDSMTLNNQASTATGTSCYYYIWNKVIALRPIPDAAETLKIFTYNRPQRVTLTSTLELDEQWHDYIQAYINREMTGKEKAFMGLYDRYDTQWKEGLKEAMKYAIKKKSTNAFGVVKVEGML